jgi:hypothetical protein
VTFEVERGVAAVAVLLVDELLGDLGAGGLRALEVRVDVVDVDVEADRLAALLLRVAVALAGIAQEDVRVAEVHLRVVHVALLAGVAEVFSKPNARDSQSSASSQLWYSRYG